ncbi:MAG: 4Fe-4S binding protein [Desulfobacterium sp.]|nr:4Fe-4S binding protein [Desulfobacterium sp.]
MENHSPLRTALYFISIVFLVVGLSLISTQIWGGKPEQLKIPSKLIIDNKMTVIEFGLANQLPETVLKELFDLQAKTDLEKPLDKYGTQDQITSLVTKKLALVSEHASKNWVKIPIKFLLWFVFLSMVFILSKRRKMTPSIKNGLLFTSVMIFGVVMGSDPGPMGTVKDAIHLYGTARAIFPPRMIALIIFLALVFISNKYICAWGCQAGTLQDLIFRINQTDKMQAVIGKQIKPPFVLTNTVRLAFFGVFTVISFLWSIDIIDPIDPFKIYKPMHMGLLGGVFVAILLLASLFIYRPWCHFFCPFGLVGWLVEKASLVKINVNYGSCIACEKCSKACPSTVMSAILKGNKKTIPDCFACYTCRDICPTASINFSSAKRTFPPSGHFDKSGKEKASSRANS